MLAEPDSGIGHELGSRDASRFAGRDALFQEVEHVEHHIGVLRVIIHRLGIALRVHQDDRQARLSSDCEGLRIVGQSGNVIEDICTCGRGAAHHFRLACVDGNKRLRFGPQSFDHGDDARKLFLKRYSIGPGACRLAANIENIGTFLRKPQAVIDRILGRAQHSTVGEAIRGNIDDAHNARAIERQTGKARAWCADRFEEIRGSKCISAPIALERISKRYDTPGGGLSLALDNFHRCKAQRLARERQPAPCLFALLQRRGE